uniref:Clathrin/coatomer adaptor adaptin-like N-terminal domain-containing protein n=1 Tax=Bicosoecida sp. CB-2014 TaxID=1486930 RepID=A0A7S1C6J5_9STRA
MAAATQAASKLGSGDAHFFEESATPEKIKKLLNNPSSGQVGVMEKTDGMKYLLAQMSKGRNVAEYFPDVVKNVIMKSVELKKMVYMYLVHHADANDECRELALLAINSFQRDLADPNQLIRSMALRVMTSIRVRDIVQLQIMAISKCATDSSPYVRKTAAHSLPKIFALAPDVKSELTEIIAKLLRDTAVMVVGSAVAAYWEVCPNNFELIHEHFRKLCAMLADIDEWGQVQIMTMLMRYARTQFLEPLARDGTNASSKPAAAAARGGAGGRGAGNISARTSASDYGAPYPSRHHGYGGGAGGGGGGGGGALSPSGSSTSSYSRDRNLGVRPSALDAYSARVYRPITEESLAAHDATEGGFSPTLDAGDVAQAPWASAVRR